MPFGIVRLFLGGADAIELVAPSNRKPAVRMRQKLRQAHMIGAMPATTALASCGCCVDLLR